MLRLSSLLSLLMVLKVGAQLPPSPDSLHLLALNSRIDDFVVAQKLASLDSLYTPDFVFSHGSGRIEGKEGWLKTVSRTKYVTRQHDSVRVQQHRTIAIIKGSMYIKRVDKDRTAKYRLQYIRVFVQRLNWWQLLSHTTTQETHL